MDTQQVRNSEFYRVTRARFLERVKEGMQATRERGEGEDDRERERDEIEAINRRN